jgi:hypothetical protein
MATNQDALQPTVAAPAQQQQQQQQQPGVMMYIPKQGRSTSEHYQKTYPPKGIRGLAIVQIVIAFIAIITQVRLMNYASQATALLWCWAVH